MTDEQTTETAALIAAVGSFLGVLAGLIVYCVNKGRLRSKCCSNDLALAAIDRIEDSAVRDEMLAEIGRHSCCRITLGHDATAPPTPAHDHPPALVHGQPSSRDRRPPDARIESEV